ncbi:DivIVA domain-containing protein [Sanguibacter sp. HDW7]|uniref:DivIVA domain-containing protein n=1 Tax=Sanguibacter sp. HDW7 TaxID=2714931 RepID=UPI001407A4E7|nr:DivIVA domain-containing protein [Sanguibacter sp. HDW7]QIK83318.1 DivIVA domain-containing protein [Sanguibacter sp. HDW7]
MELLTTDDILNKKFTATKFREGYDIVEVDDFLDEVLNTLRAYEGENGDLKSKLAAAERRVAELTRQIAAQAAAAAATPAPVASAPEPTPAPAPEPAPVVAPAPVAPARVSEPESATGMLQLAQKLHDDYVRSGQEEGDRLVTEARNEGERIVRDAQETSARTLGQLEQERGLLERKIDELRQFERDYRTRLQSYLENLLGDLNNRGAVMPGGEKDSGRSI